VAGGYDGLQPHGSGPCGTPSSVNHSLIPPWTDPSAEATDSAFFGKGSSSHHSTCSRRSGQGKEDNEEKRKEQGSSEDDVVHGLAVPFAGQGEITLLQLKSKMVMIVSCKLCCLHHDVWSVTGRGFTPLMTAVAEKDIYSLNQCLGGGKVGVDDQSLSKMTALHLACALRNQPSVSALLKHGADLTICDRVGRSPLMIASMRGDKEIVQFLLEKGASEDDFINSLDSFQYSALCYASMRGSKGVAKLLLEHGADPGTRVVSISRTPGGLARRFGHDRLADILDEARHSQVC